MWGFKSPLAHRHDQEQPGVKTVIAGAVPPEIEQLIKHRHQLGQDLYDEIWEGDYHMAPAPGNDHGYLQHALTLLLGRRAEAAGLSGSGPFNLGEPDDYRVPDLGYHRTRPAGVWSPTCAVVVEIVSPDDDTFVKFGFYAARGVDEVLVVDGAERTVHWFSLHGDEYAPVVGSSLLATTSADLAGEIDWP
jgi:Uma2 family endonuclease